MPTKRKRDYRLQDELAVFSSKSVEDICRLITANPPWPDEAACLMTASLLTSLSFDGQADIMNEYTEESNYKRKWEASADFLQETRKLIPSRIVDQHAEALLKLENSIKEFRAILKIKPYASPDVRTRWNHMAPWTVLSLNVVLISEGIWNKARGKPVGVTRNSLVIKFTGEVLHRMGWRTAYGGRISNDAIAKNFATLMREDRKRGESNPPRSSP